MLNVQDGPQKEYLCAKVHVPLEETCMSLSQWKDRPPRLGFAKCCPVLSLPSFGCTSVTAKPNDRVFERTVSQPAREQNHLPSPIRSGPEHGRC